MGYTEFILTINSSCITILIILAIILLVATRFRGENGYAAAIIVLPNVPVYIYNMSRMLGWHEITLFMFPISYSVNTMLMPLLWLFTLRNFDTDFRFRPIQLLHFIPAAISVIIVLSLSTQERMDNIIYEMSGDDMWVGNLNTLIILFQMFLYFAAIFRYLHKRDTISKKTGLMRNTCKRVDTETDVPVCRPVCYRHDLLCDMAPDGRLADTNTECYSYELFDIQLYSTSGRTFHNRRSVGHRKQQ